ncbi:molecular chaperone MKKS-like [Glandiceps talaboti]
MDVNPGITVAPSQQSTISIQTLNDPEVLHSIQLFKNIMSSCYGPRGRIKIIQNNSGGTVTMTSMSAVLLESVSVSNPILQLVKSAVQSHLARFSDGGLFIALFTSALIEKCVQLDIPRTVCICINEFMLRQTIEYLESEECRCKIKMDFSDSNRMLNLVKGVIESKPACCLLPKEKSIISSLVLQAFLQSLAGEPKHSNHATIGTIQYVNIEGRPVTDSQLLPGVLFQAPYLPTYKCCVSELRHVSGGPMQGLVRVALYNISMSGDSDEFVEVQYESTSGMTSSDIVVQKMLNVVEDLVKQGIGLLACQKVIHPAVKKYCRQQKILTLDRLSLTHINAVQYVTGARLLSTLHTSVTESDFGYLTNVSHKVIFGKSFLHLESLASNVITLILCNRTEQSVQELKRVCENVDVILRHSLVNPVALLGAGITECCLINHLRKQMDILASPISKELYCRESHFVAVSTAFIECLQTIVRHVSHNINCIDAVDCCQYNPDYTHIEDTPVDCFTMKINAFKVVVEISNVVLQINNYIHDTK